MRESSKPRFRTLPTFCSELVKPVGCAGAGRCGRVQHGVCSRLYSEDDYAKRARFTDPEVQRSSLAGVILRMKSLGLGDVAEFPFVEPPP